MFVVEPAVVSRGGRSSHQIYRPFRWKGLPFIHIHASLNLKPKARPERSTLQSSLAGHQRSIEYPLPVEARLT
jgi:hypothetical protein